MEKYSNLFNASGSSWPKIWKICTIEKNVYKHRHWELKLNTKTINPEIKSDEYEWFVMECIHADISAKSYTLKNSQANIFWKSIGKHIFLIFFFIFTLFYFTILYWFCHTLAWIHHGCIQAPNPESPSHLPPISSLWIIPMHQPQASCILYQT